MPDAPSLIEQTLQVFSISGFVIAVLAGTSAVHKASSWWRFAGLAAVGAATVHVGIAIYGEFPKHDVTDPGYYGLMFLYFTVAALIAAGVGRVCYRFNLPGPLRIAFCLVSDLVVRGIAVAVFFMAVWRTSDTVCGCLTTTYRERIRWMPFCSSR